MSPRTRPPARPVTVALCLIALSVVTALCCAATSQAAEYKMLGCSGSARDPFYTIANNTASPQNPAGIFNFWNNCGGQGFDPPGNDAFLRIEENQASGYAGQFASLGFVFDTPNQFIHFRSAGGYTREPASFNDGWRSRMWISGGSTGDRQLMTQGSGLCNCGDQWSTTSTFSPHLWPLGGYLDFTRFVWEMQCVRPGGCDRSGVNVTDLNGMVFVLSDEYRSAVNLLATDQPFMSGRWVRGAQTVAYNWTELGSGMKLERVKVDGAVREEINHNCDVSSSQANGEYARSYQPCDAAADIKRYFGLDTATLADGAHTVAACTQDYAQWGNLNGSGGESCDSRTVRTDNTAPGAPSGLTVTSANPARYLPRFGAAFSLPPNPGSPITRVLYQVLNAAGEPIGPVGAYSATDPTAVPQITGPAKAGDYRLRVWLEDEVGFAGPAAIAQIPHDTTPPAAPQNPGANGPTSWGPAQGYRLRWNDVVDAGSPIIAAHYRVVDDAGNAVEPVRTVAGENVEALAELEVPRRAENFSAQVWLEDEEGNVGAAATVPLPRDTTPPAAPQDLSVTPPGISRAERGFDVRWRNAIDGGSPITSAHYQVLNAGGDVVVSTQTAGANNVELIQSIEPPRAAGKYTLRLWLQDAEGNVGVATTAPLSYECLRSEASGGTKLTTGLGEKGGAEEVVAQGTGSSLRGKLTGSGGGTGGASLCVFSRVVTQEQREFVGLALTNPDGSFQFAVPPGPSREVGAIYRSGSREVSDRATIKTVVHPTFGAYRKVVYNKQKAQFVGSIPGPDNGNVVVVLQVRRGKGWLAFRRYRTREDGRFTVPYKFNKTNVATKYVMRVQVRAQSGYPYLQGNSDNLTLIVLPKSAREAAARKPRDISRPRAATASASSRGAARRSPQMGVASAQVAGGR